MRNWIAANSLLLTTSCSMFETSEATHLLNGPSYPPVEVASVQTFLAKPAFAYTEVGIVEARGIGVSTEARDMDLAIKALKKEAASIGANGVIIHRSDQQIASVSARGTATERRIVGTAIRFPPLTK